MDVSLAAAWKDWPAMARLRVESPEACFKCNRHKFVIHNGNAIFSAEMVEEVQSFGLKVLKTPVRPLQASIARAADRLSTAGVSRFHYSFHLARTPPQFVA